MKGSDSFDTKPENISGRFLRLTSASAREMTFLKLSHFAQIDFADIYILVPYETQNNFSHLYLCIYIYIYAYRDIYVRASEGKNIETRRMRKLLKEHQQR